MLGLRARLVASLQGRRRFTIPTFRSGASGTAADPSVAETTNEPFGIVLGEFLLERDYATRTGKPNWSTFAAELEGIHYETLRLAVTGRRSPSPRLMEECARLLAIRPEHFLEYRLYLARRQLDPNEVGLRRSAENLTTWTARERGEKPRVDT